MSTNRKGLLNKFPTIAACLCGKARVDSDYLMTGSRSLILKNSEKRAPTGVHDGFRKVMVLYHIADGKVFNGNMMIVVSVLFSRLEMEVTALTSNLEMRLSRVLRSLVASLASLLAAAKLALFASKCLLRGAIVTRVLNGIAFTVSQEDFQANINADVRMVTRRGKMVCLGLGLTHDEGIPVTISTKHEMSGLGGSLYRAMEFDFDGAAQLLGDIQVFSIGMQHDITVVLGITVLPQLDGMPSIGLLEARETYSRDVMLLGRKKSFERLTQTVGKHLNGGGGNMFTLPLKSLFQVIFTWEGAILRILSLDGLQHLIIDVSRLDQALHEQVTLGFIWEEAVFVCPHIDTLPQFIRNVKWMFSACGRRRFTPMARSQGHSRRFQVEMRRESEEVSIAK